MRFLITNPAGLWALLALPVIAAIHFLQERSRKVRTSTLFLLDRVKPESVGGARFERLRHSVPLWMQLLAAAVIAWMLAEPRWIREDSRQTLVVVLDSSVSMSAFKEPTRQLLAGKLRGLSQTVAKTEWHLLESNPRKPTLYTGAELAGMMEAYDRWEPTLGTHRPDDALITARGLVKRNGLVIFVTDRKAEVPSDVAVLSAAEALENVGFAGVEVKLINEAANATSGTKWRALIKNYGRETQTREWWVEAEETLKSGSPITKDKLTLEPGQTLALNGELPPGIERATIVISADKFIWDDRMPIQKPKPRLVNADIRVGGRTGDVLRKMLTAMDHVSLAGGQLPILPSELPIPTSPDLIVSELGTGVDTNAIQLASSAGDDTRLDAAFTVAEDHLLTRDLNWMGLLTGKPLELTVSENDEPLLWKGDRVLALLRNDQAADGHKIRRLILGWDLAASNAARNPAVLVMLQRFVELVRDSKREPWAGNFEVGQRVELANDKSAFAKAKLHTADADVAFTERVPEHPGFFDVVMEGKPFISGAASFADTREADFRDAAPLDTVEARRWEAAMKQTEADPWMPLWVLGVLGCLLVSWASIGSRFKVSGSSKTLAAPSLQPLNLKP